MNVASSGKNCVTCVASSNPSAGSQAACCRPFLGRGLGQPSPWPDVARASKPPSPPILPPSHDSTNMFYPPPVCCHDPVPTQPPFRDRSIFMAPKWAFCVLFGRLKTALTPPLPFFVCKPLLPKTRNSYRSNETNRS